MLIRKSTWKLIRERFTEEEKAQLNRAIQGEAICPRGVVVGADALGAALRAKVEAALKGAENR